MSGRRGIGLNAFSSAISAEQFAKHGETLRLNHAEALANQLSVFQASLHNFSLIHAKDIRQNTEFRQEFARMCNAIGVDPLAGSNVKADGKTSSVWAKMLGSSVNDFYFELAVRLVELCRETRAENGGMVPLSEARKRIGKGRAIGGGMDITDDDVERALDCLKPLSGGFKLVTVGSQKFIHSVPKELNTDQARVLEVTQILGYATVSMLSDNLNWESARASSVLEDMVTDGLLWIDQQAPEVEYWSAASMHDGV